MKLMRIIVIPLMLFVLAVVVGVLLPGVIYPPLTVDGYDPHPLQTANRDLALDDQRRMVFVVVVCRKL